MKKKYLVTFLFDKKNLWFYEQFKKFNFNLQRKFTFKITKNKSQVVNQDIVFPLCYTKILPEKFLKKNKLTLIVHPSKLPKNKGFSPLQHEILKNKNKFYISLIKAVKDVDAGPIILQNKFKLKGDELSQEIRYIQGKQILKIIKQFLLIYPKFKYKVQTGKASFNKRRHPKDSELSIKKTIKEQFNHLRINDNNLYPSFFYYKNNKYIIKIFKEKV